MSIVIVETHSNTPLTPDQPTENDFQLLSCLEERDAVWRYSMYSSDRLRMICTFDAPDAEVVRESYRRTQVTFTRVWAGSIVRPEDNQPQQNKAVLKVVEATYPDSLTHEQWNEIHQSVLSDYADNGVEWVQSYVSRDRSRLVTELNTPSIKAIEAAHHHNGVTSYRVWTANVLTTV